LLAAARSIAGAVEACDQTVAEQAYWNRLVLDREIADADHFLGFETRRQKTQGAREREEGNRLADHDLPEASLLFRHGQNTLRSRPIRPPRVFPMSPVSV